MIKKGCLVLLLSLLLCSCVTVSDDLPGWIDDPPESDSVHSFVGYGEAINAQQARNEAYTDILQSLSDYLGSDVAGRYYTELTQKDTINELGLKIKKVYQAREGGVEICYLLASGSAEKIIARRSEDYAKLLSREGRIAEYIDEALAEYRGNNDVAAIEAYLNAVSLALSGNVDNPDYQSEVLLEKAHEILKHLEIRVKRVDEEKGTARVSLRRKRGLFSPSVHGANVVSQYMVNASIGADYLGEFEWETDKNGQFIFAPTNPYMARSGTVSFRLDLDDAIIPLSKIAPDHFLDSFAADLDRITDSFTYAMRSRKSKDGILVFFSEYDRQGMLIADTSARDAFVSHCQTNRTEVSVVSSDEEERDDAINDIRVRYPEQRYLVWCIAGAETPVKVEDGTFGVHVQGVIQLIDLRSLEVLEENSLASAIAWNADVAVAQRRAFSEYGHIVASGLIASL